MNMYLYRVSFIFACLFILISCSDGPQRDVEYTIYTTYSAIELIEGEEFQITASPSTQSFIWETSNSAVATVSSTGLVHAISDGTCFINITSSEGLKKSIPVDVQKLLLLEDVGVFVKSNLAPVEHVVIQFGKTIELAVSAVPLNYNERVPFNIIWESSDEDIVKVDQTGKIISTGVGSAEVTASVEGKPTVNKVIPIEILENPITSIKVVNKLDLMLNKKYKVEPIRMPLDYGVNDDSLVWESSDESIVEVIDGEVNPLGIGTAIVTVSLNSNPEIKSNITINVANIVIDSFVDAGSNLVQSNVFFEYGKEVSIIGVNPSNFEVAYNRDFMSYNSDTGQITFIAETGYWDVFYSTKYNYFWVARMSDVAPECYWIIGEGFSSASVWHNDFATGGTSVTNMRQMAYMRNLGDNKYQATISIGNSFDILTFADRKWGGQLSGFDLIAPEGMELNADNKSNITDSNGFIPGYYRFVFDSNNEIFIIEKVD